VPISLEIRAKIRELPNKPGVYLFRDRLGRVIYVGKARALRRRVSQYFHPSRKLKYDVKTRALIDGIADFETFVVRSEPEALLLEGKLIKEYKPRYNVMFRDDKRFALVKVDMRETYPRFRIARLKKDDAARYFGPFAHAGALRQTLNYLRKQYGILMFGSGNPTERELKYSTYQVPARLSDLTAEQYRERVEKACEFLEGKARDQISDLEAQMKKAAAAQEYEKAAQLRDLIESLREVSKRTRKFEREVRRPFEPEKEMAELQQALSLPTLPRHIEGFDISNIGGTLSVASEVCFVDGKPHKDHYRHYRIKTVQGSDDFASIAEVVSRRYTRVLKEGGKMPDLILIDGGAGQLHAAQRELWKLGLDEQPVIGLAKKLEEIYVPQSVSRAQQRAEGGNLKPEGEARSSSHKEAQKGTKTPQSGGTRSVASDAPTRSRQSVTLHSENISTEGNKENKASLTSLPSVQDSAPPPQVSGLSPHPSPSSFLLHNSSFRVLRLPSTSPALHLLQRLRDEAHRFANQYHQKLRKRRIQESVLDEFAGIGENRKKLLLQHFGSIQRLREASVEEMTKVSGVGTKLATALKEFLTKV
jgi:excinuclease ABC subunit C